MYRRDHVALAKAVRDAAEKTGVDPKVTRTFADHIAEVCAQRTPGSATFDPELFMAFALSPVQPTLSE